MTVVRLKPVLSPCWACIEPGLLQLADGQLGSHLYSFDRTLEGSASTQEVFQALDEERFCLAALQVSRLSSGAVQTTSCHFCSGTRLSLLAASCSDRLWLSAAACVQGLAVSMLMYGPTGSGKTHTTAELLPLVSASLFGAMRKQADREITLRVSAMEIYNERVRFVLE